MLSYFPFKDEESHKGFYFCELLDNVQCSRSELLAQLEEIKAIKLEGILKNYCYYELGVHCLLK